MQQYLDGLKHILVNGVMRNDRTGKGRLGVFCPPQERYRLSDGFPLVTTREIKPQAMIDELLWFISGDTSIDSLKSKFFWKKWALTKEQANEYITKHRLSLDSEEAADITSRIGTIGNLYGVSWRHAPGPEGKRSLPFRHPDQMPLDFLTKHIPCFGDTPMFSDARSFKSWLNAEDDSVTSSMLKGQITQTLNQLYWEKTDQLNELIINIKERPFSSRLRVTAMIPQYTAFEDFSIAENIADGRAALTPCHAMFQFYVKPAEGEDKNELSLSLTMTSNDYPVGRVYNIAQYALLLSMIAQVTDCEPGELIVNVNDGHIYSDQIEMVKEQIHRTPLPLPKLWLNPEIKDIFAFTSDDIKIVDYQFHPEIKYPVAV